MAPRCFFKLAQAQEICVGMIRSNRIRILIEFVRTAFLGGPVALLLMEMKRSVRTILVDERSQLCINCRSYKDLVPLCADAVLP